MAYSNQLMNQAVQGGGNLLQLPKYNQQNQGGVEALLGQLRNMGMQGLQNPQQGFAPIEEASRRGFENRTIPLLAERFGGLNATGSSGYNNALGGAGTDFELGLNAQRAQFGQQNIGQLLQMLQLGLQPSTENIYTPPGQSFGSSLAGGLGTGAGLAGTLGLGGALSSGGLSGLLSSLAGYLPSTIGAGAGAVGAAGGLGTAAAGTAAALPPLWPILAALAVGAGGAYGISKLAGD